MSGRYEVVLGYTWPGGDRKLEWWDAKARANAIGRRFRQILEKIDETGPACVDLISHSLGARVSLKALKDAGKTLVRNYYCMAGAVDNESLENDEEFARAIQGTKRVFVLHSIRDEVLSTAYRAAEWDNPIGLSGPEDKDAVEKNPSIFVANCKHVVSDHGGYKRSTKVYEYLRKSDEVSRFVTLTP